MLHRQLKLPLNKRDLSINKYYIPFCADCPICQGQNKLIIREDNTNSINTDLVIICESCHTGGFIDDWNRIAESDTILPNTHRDISNIYIDSLKYFRENYYKCESYMNNLGYFSPELPPGNSLSILTRGQLERIAEKLECPLNMRHIDYYIALPIYRHPGLICDIMVNDGVKYSKLFDSRVAGQYCGTLSNAFVKKLFLVESVAELVRFSGKQRLESIDHMDVQVIAGLFGAAGRGPEVISAGRIRAETVYVLRKTAIKRPKLWEYNIRHVAGAVRIVEDWEDKRLAVVVANAFDMSRLVNNRDKPTIQMRREEISRMYRFVIKDSYVCVTGFNKTKARSSDMKAIMSGVVHIEETGDRKYRITYRRQTKKPTVVIEDVPEAIFRDRTVFNIYLADYLPEEQGRRFTLLLDWFDTHDILSNLVLISKQTAEVFKKGESYAD